MRCDADGFALELQAGSDSPLHRVLRLLVLGGNPYPLAKMVGNNEGATGCFILRGG